MQSISIELKSEADTLKLGERLAAHAVPGLVVALVGELGAGKTTFTRGFARALGVPEELVTSPTYLLQQDYATNRGYFIFHFDAYRLDDPDQFEALGVGETFDSGGVSLVEWADRAEESLPADAWWIKINHSADGLSRTVQLQLPDTVAERLIWP